MAYAHLLKIPQVTMSHLFPITTEALKFIMHIQVLINPSSPDLLLRQSRDFYPPGWTFYAKRLNFQKLGKEDTFAGHYFDHHHPTQYTHLLLRLLNALGALCVPLLSRRI